MLYVNSRGGSNTPRLLFCCSSYCPVNTGKQLELQKPVKKDGLVLLEVNIDRQFVVLDSYGVVCPHYLNPVNQL
jgi:hypothetical protein